MKIIVIFALAAFGILAQILLKRGVRGVEIVDVQSVLKHSFDLMLNPYIISALLIYIVGFAVYMLLLTKMQVSTLYPLTVAAAFTMLTVASYFFLSETVSLLKIAGLVMILSGITCLSLAVQK